MLTEKLQTLILSPKISLLPHFGLNNFPSKSFKKFLKIVTFTYIYGEGNLIFCSTGSRENYFGSVVRQNRQKLVLSGHQNLLDEFDHSLYSEIQQYQMD